jgi:hypothetical protein
MSRFDLDNVPFSIDLGCIGCFEMCFCFLSLVFDCDFQAVLKLDLEEWQHSIREKERALAELEVLQAQARSYRLHDFFLIINPHKKHAQILLLLSSGGS